MATSARRAVRTLVLPMLQAQADLLPDTMSEADKKRLLKSQKAAETLEPATDRGVIAAVALCLASTLCFIGGGIRSLWSRGV